MRRRRPRTRCCKSCEKTAGRMTRGTRERVLMSATGVMVTAYCAVFQGTSEQCTVRAVVELS